jgi:phosphoenolpyruvate phosphomutase
MDKKTVYVAMSADIIHNGHINLIKRAAALGELTVGVLTDEAIASYKRYPLMHLRERMEIIGNLVGVSHVIAQTSLDYEENLRLLKPDYVVHGDDWRSGIQSSIREKVIATLAEWNGQLVEIPYTEGVSIERLRIKMDAEGVLPEQRRARLANLLKVKPMVRVLEAHNGLTGLIVENTRVVKENEIHGFDAMWISSLCDSTAKGKPDIELVDMTSRLDTINQIMEVTTKPIILDGDTGGQIEHFVFNIKTLERIGVSAVIIEDKVGLKKNSLFGTEVDQQQDTIDNFCRKITAGKQAQKTRDFMIIARIESLILDQGMVDALTRARAYVQAGADGIMIHSRKKDPSEVYEFCDIFRAEYPKVPIIVVPSSFSSSYESELQEHGVRIVIYANHLIRSAFPAMKKTAESILEHGRCLEASELCLPIKEVIRLIPGGE